MDNTERDEQTRQVVRGQRCSGEPQPKIGGKEVRLEEISSPWQGVPVTPAKARAEIRRAAILRRVWFSPHARQRMAQRSVFVEDVYNALGNLTSCKSTEEDRWKVTGPDIDGDELTVMVAIEAGVVVVTVF